MFLNPPPLFSCVAFYDQNAKYVFRNGAVLEGVAGEAVSEIEGLFSDPLGEDLLPLKKYLLSGRGWMFITLLHALPLKVKNYYFVFG